MAKMRTVLIFAYYSYKDPVFQSAVLPYFQGQQDSFQFVLLTWEQKQFELSKTASTEIKESLKKQNIHWHKVNWHSGRFKILKKFYDFLFGVIYTLRLILKYKVEIVYSEGFPGAIISHFIASISRKPHVVHTFEPHADYMIEGGTWADNSWEARLVKSLERKIAKKAKGIVTATQAYKDIIVSWCVEEKKVVTLPSAVDTKLFYFDTMARDQIRKELNISPDQIVITYLGKFGGMYMEQELFDFFQVCYLMNKDRFRFFIFSGDDHMKIEQWIADKQLPRDIFLVKKLEREQVPKYLSAADYGFVAVRQFPSKRYCSPIKNGEYWACGLPIIIPEAVSDDFITVNQHPYLGETLEKTELAEYRELVNKLLECNSGHQKVEISNFASDNRSVDIVAKKILSLLK